MNPALKPTKKEIVTEFRTREILAAARRLMQSRGVEAVTMEEIAAAAGVAKGTVYLYFQGKEDLIQALISQVGENILVRDRGDRAGKPGSTGEDSTGGLRAPGLPDARSGLCSRPMPGICSGAGGERPRPTGSHLQEMEEKFVNTGDQVVCRRHRMRASLFRPTPGSSPFYCGAWCGRWAITRWRKARKTAVKEALPVLLTLLSSGCWPGNPKPPQRWPLMKSSKLCRLVLLGLVDLELWPSCPRPRPPRPAWT